MRFFYDAFGRRVRKDVHPPLPNEEELRKLADEELRPALEAEEERRRAELAALDEIPDEQAADEFQPANSNQSTAPGALQVRPPATVGADQALLPASEEEELVLAHKLKTYEVRFLWDRDELAAEIHSDQGERVHVHRPGTFVPLMQVEGGEAFHVITDHLGTPKELIDGQSRVTWSAAHGTWNNIQEQWFDDVHPRGRRVSSPFRGLGQYYDSETQLSSTRYRYWEAETGRWLSGDPLGIDGGSNLLGFDGVPTIDVDPLGLAEEELETGTMKSLTKVGDGFDNHEVIQHAWLRDNVENYPTRRNTGIGNDNPAIALRRENHSPITTRQVAEQLHKEPDFRTHLERNLTLLDDQMKKQNVDAKTRRATIRRLRADAMAYARKHFPCKL